MTRIVLLNKPYGVLCQFSAGSDKPTLKNFVGIPDIYPAGRLDADSEGLVVLTDDGALQTRISHPRYKLAKTYWAQVEGIPDEPALRALRQGVALHGYVTAPAQARLIEEPAALWPRDPPIRCRRNIPTRWLEIALTQGKNRQVRHMTAAVGHPTLRLIRFAVGAWTVERLTVGEHRLLTPDETRQAMSTSVPAARYSK